ncbi:MAG: hypothetical protein PHS84_01945 [Paludibacter sp.]|jgi:hypothetical protein|nr:hypothetical protein [Paludibacter sp.]
MRKIITLAFTIVLLSITTSIYAQEVFYHESFGNPPYEKTEVLTKHVWDYDSSTAGITYSWTYDEAVSPDSVASINVRFNNPSSGYTDVTGNGNLYFNSSVNNTFTISGNTSDFDNILLSFGIFGKNSGDAKKLVVQYAVNGGSFSSIAADKIASVNAIAKTWEWISTVSVPSANILSLKFSTPTGGEIRIDDVVLQGVKKNTAVIQPDSDRRKIIVSNSSITLQGFSEGKIEIYTIQGKKVFSSELIETINPQLRSGLYIIKIGNFTQKICL